MKVRGKVRGKVRNDRCGSGMDNRSAFRWRWLLAAAVLWCAVIAVAGCAVKSDSGIVDAVVERVIDGDTIAVNIRGQEEKVRLLLVDTPETSHPDKPVQPFGPEASEFAREVLEGREVQLEFDGPERDKYDRLLAYVWVDGKLFNEMLLEQGLARIAYVYDPPYRYYDLLTRAQNQSRKARIGIWSIEGYVREDGFDEKAAEIAVSGGSSAGGQPAAKGADSEAGDGMSAGGPGEDNAGDGDTGTAVGAGDDAVPSCPDPKIKGNINSRGEKIYHLPGGRYYKQTKAEQWFCTEEEAAAAGFRAAKR
jgi:Micrococcal nuclease (thermonuclease) homologs